MFTYWARETDRRRDEIFQETESACLTFNSADLIREQGMIYQLELITFYWTLLLKINNKEWDQKIYKNNENVKWKKIHMVS